MTVQFQKKLLGQHPARFIVDLDALRGFIEQFSNLLVILRNRITGVRLELQQLHGPAGPRPPSQRGGPPGPPESSHMGQMDQQLGLSGQQQHGVGLQNQPPVPPQGLGRVSTSQGMGRVSTPLQMMQARVPTASTSTKGNKRPHEDDPVTAAVGPKRAKADWEGLPSDVQERRVEAAEEAPRDDAAAADFLDDRRRHFLPFKRDVAPLVSGLNAMSASVMPSGEGEGEGEKDESGLESGLGADDLFDSSQYLGFDDGLGTGGNGGAGTVGATPEFVLGSSASS